MVVSDRRAACVVAREEEAAMGMETERDDGRAEAVARDGKVEIVARHGGGGKVETEAAGAGGKRRSSPRFADCVLDEEILRGNCVMPGELPRRKRKAIAKRSKLRIDGVEVQNGMGQAQCLGPVFNGSNQVYEENENLRLQLALKTKELEHEQNRRLKLELILKTKEIESLQKQNEELKAENKNLKKNAKPPRVKRLCRFCEKHDWHDYRNCPERRRAATSPEEESDDAA